MFIAEALPREPSSVRSGMSDWRADEWFHAAPTELAGSWRSRCYKLSVISVISCSNPSQQFRTESETPWTGRSETCPTPRQNEFPGGKPCARMRARSCGSKTLQSR